MTQRAQRRGRAIAMTAAEVDEFLADERTGRVATAGKDGRPHVAPLWFVWDGAPDPVLDQVEQLFADKYTGRAKFPPDGRHAWLELTPEKLVSWDFRKLATLSR